MFGYEGGDFLSGGEGDDLYTVTTSDNARYSDAGPDHIDEQLGGGNDTIKFTDLDRSEISLNVDIDNSDTDLWLSSSEDLEDGQNDSGVIIEDFFVIKDGSYAFNNDNVIENVATADNYTVDLTDIDLDAINAAYEASQASAATIA
ncbi:hypothetical protein L861_22610 [Litchfieldella anticariensis FP35 = DSM 16096]|uniref:Haemolysin-type calcium binding-related domain-containing protein n=1 Tax=Litchfieldella anticariensis (strain DSM 16096 / CECT 5854 / CIP 108499 / LMG 22089 / FP35) TaxID=1121939 RepID=S2KMF6_LITA3|nr:hypothetical protein L861_22610 [Halomonas anticariensis FP35 = DSM 16096]